MATIRYCAVCGGMKDAVEAVMEQGNVYRQCLSCGDTSVIVCVNNNPVTKSSGTNLHKPTECA